VSDAGGSTEKAFTSSSSPKRLLGKYDCCPEVSLDDKRRIIYCFLRKCEVSANAGRFKAAIMKSGPRGGQFQGQYDYWDKVLSALKWLQCTNGTSKSRITENGVEL